MEDTMGYKSFCHKPALLTRYEILRATNKISKDEDSLIALLKDKPLMKYREIMESTGWGFAKTKKVMEDLVNNKVIRFSVDPNYVALGLEFHNILVKINQAKQKHFEQIIHNHQRVHWVKKCLGRWDYILSLTAPNIQEFIDTTRELQEQWKDDVFEFTTLISKIDVMRQY
jgi:DNA-binding Lrp family transcriptional regulator